jgi:hypothetical protein
MGIIEAFDNTSEEILKPSHMVKKVEDFPEIVIVKCILQTIFFLFTN